MIKAISAFDEYQNIKIKKNYEFNGNQIIFGP